MGIPDRRTIEVIKGESAELARHLRSNGFSNVSEQQGLRVLHRPPPGDGLEASMSLIDEITPSRRAHGVDLVVTRHGAEDGWRAYRADGRQLPSGRYYGPTCATAEEALDAMEEQLFPLLPDGVHALVVDEVRTHRSEIIGPRRIWRVRLTAPGARTHSDVYDFFSGSDRALWKPQSLGLSSVLDLPQLLGQVLVLETATERYQDEQRVRVRRYVGGPGPV